jgi:hypothetical protein
MRPIIGCFAMPSTKLRAVTFRLVLAEVDYFLRNERQAMRTFMQDVARGAFTYVPPSLDQLSRAMEVDRRYADLGLGLVDGSNPALQGAPDSVLVNPLCCSPG